MSARDFGETLRTWREARRIGVRELAREVGLSPTYISHIELGRANPPAKEHLIRFSQLLGVPQSLMFTAAGRVEDDVLDVLIRRPELWHLVRAAGRLSTGDLVALIEAAESIKKKTRKVTARDDNDRRT